MRPFSRQVTAEAGRDANISYQRGRTAMSTFETPEPITVTIDLGVGDIRLIASDRRDTTVNVSPKNGFRAADMKVAERTRVEYSNGKLLVQGPKQRFHLFRSEAIDVTIELPAGSE